MQIAHARKSEIDQGEKAMSALPQNGGFEIIQPVPKLDGKIFDARGDTVRPATHTIMARLDAKTTEQVTLSKGTLWLLGAGVVILNLVLSYGGSMVGWVRDDQNQRTQLNSVQDQMKETRDDVKELTNKFDDIQKALNAQAIKDAENKGKELGYSVGRADKQAGH